MDLLKTAGLYLLARFGEASTWSTVIGSGAAELGLKLNPHFDSSLVQLGLAAATAAGILIKEGWQAKSQ